MNKVSWKSALFYEFSLETRVPADHRLRSIDRFVDSLFDLPTSYFSQQLNQRTSSRATARLFQQIVVPFGNGQFGTDSGGPRRYTCRYSSGSARRTRFPF
jgi:hypothetical protein